MTRPGRIIGVGRTSVVYEFGRGSVAKVRRIGVPAHWPAVEAEITAAVHDRGVSTPAVRGLDVVDGREAIVFERIEGPSLWEEVRAGRRAVADCGVRLAEIQLAIHAEAAPPSLPTVSERVRAKIDAAPSLSGAERAEARAIVDGLPPGSSLCHGDLHPGNILMSERGPVVIDWFDAAVGSATADVVRSSLLIRPPRGSARPLHLPGWSSSGLSRLHHGYLRRVLSEVELVPQVARGWEAVLAASRLAERAESDESGLMALWRDRGATAASPLIDAISARSTLGPEPGSGR